MNVTFPFILVSKCQLVNNRLFWTTIYAIDKASSAYEDLKSCWAFLFRRILHEFCTKNEGLACGRWPVLLVQFKLGAKLISRAWSWLSKEPRRSAGANDFPTRREPSLIKSLKREASCNAGAYGDSKLHLATRGRSCVSSVLQEKQKLMSGVPHSPYRRQAKTSLELEKPREIGQMQRLQ